MSSHDEGISDANFERLRSLIYAESGINLSLDKKTMLELRIKRRLSLQQDTSQTKEPIRYTTQRTSVRVTALT